MESLLATENLTKAASTRKWHLQQVPQNDMASWVRFQSGHLARDAFGVLDINDA